ncbi:hypothetical protein HHK36_021258 [Tetracentron sinense]|uniref:Nuclear nucleic acid-binding protein C1D n=1 Tax=Tetracentron sinense TaxID=13715 RepID=A0A835D9R3_TETSI|nr:hypothetical protein HHK36_021258 [Tetracentron sinense]
MDDQDLESYTPLVFSDLGLDHRSGELISSFEPLEVLRGRTVGEGSGMVAVVVAKGEDDAGRVPCAQDLGCTELLSSLRPGVGSDQHLEGVQGALSITMMGRGGRRESTAVPEAVMEAMNRSLVNVDELSGNLREFLALCEPDVLAEMPPLRRAQALLLVAKTTSILFALRLRCSGVHPDNHPVNTELERLSLYHDKLERFMDLSKAPLRPSATLNYQAATRFIEHSLPDLTPGQKQSMRDISRGDGVKNGSLENRSALKKRKYQSSEKHSVRAAAQEFLEKAARELLGPNSDDVKGPIRIETSDEEDLPMG